MLSNILTSITNSKNQEDNNNLINISDQETQEKSDNSNSMHNTTKEMELRLQMENLKFIHEDLEYNPVNMYAKYSEIYLNNWSYSNLKDEYRPEYANKSSGGIEFNNKEVTSMLRSTGYDIIKQIGKKIITGDFNLTTVSFPIKVMLPFTILQAIAKSVIQFPIYLNLAANQIDPLEKFKMVIVATISCFHKSSLFLKPLNPILGETYEMFYEDGSKIYLEQSSHHPPISHFIMYGPNKGYKFSGFSDFNSGAGLNSLKLYNKGKRLIELRDGTKISTTFCNEVFSNTFFGTVRHESLGEIVFKDLTNGFECTLKFDSVKKKQSDYFSGEIKVKKNTVCKILGSYLSFIEFNGIRYWDIRQNVPINPIEIENQLKSSSLYRQDRILLEQRDLIDAQSVKEKLEESQRQDKKLRDKYAKAHK